MMIDHCVYLTKRSIRGVFNTNRKNTRVIRFVYRQQEMKKNIDT